VAAGKLGKLRAERNARPQLTVVGTGIQIARDFTPAARGCIESADKVFYLAGDRVAARIIEELNPTAESLHTSYDPGKRRIRTYEEMAERIMSRVRGGDDVCVAVYGHPGFFAYPMHRAIHQARREGFEAAMLPAVSSLDCLLADLGIDPAERGLQVYEASDFLLRPRGFDPRVALVLLQLHVVGEPGFESEPNRAGFLLLVKRLRRRYGARHEAVVYAAAEYVWGKPSIQRVTVGTLASATIGAGSTLFLPPKGRVSVDEDMQHRLAESVRAARTS